MPRLPRKSDAPVQRVLDLPHSPALGRADFLVSDCNREALLWIERWPDWPAHALALYGPPGSGKTHLAAIWSHAARATVYKARDIDLRLPEDLIAAPRPVIIDDADALIGDPDYERALFHVYNAQKEHKQGLLLAATAAPARWPTKLPDLRSRLSSVPALGVAAPDDALLSALLAKLFADRQLRVGDGVIAYALPRIERSFDAVRDLVARLDALALAEKRPVTVALARAIIEDAGYRD